MEFPSPQNEDDDDRPNNQSQFRLLLIEQENQRINVDHRKFEKVESSRVELGGLLRPYVARTLNFTAFVYLDRDNKYQNAFENIVEKGEH